MKFKGTKTAIEYIDDEYGIEHLSTVSELNDIASIFGLMQEFSDYNLKRSKAPEMLEAMQEFCDRVDRGEVRSTKTYNKFKSIIKSATVLKEE